MFVINKLENMKFGQNQENINKSMYFEYVAAKKNIKTKCLVRLKKIASPMNIMR